MMRIVIAPDKFKGSLPATAVAAAITAGLRVVCPGAELVTIPVADGGEGTVDAAVAAGFERVPVTGADWSLTPGSGAAGGVGFAARAALGAQSRPGIGLVLELAGFDAALADADLVITGEGSLDAQSLTGKAPVGVARAAARLGIPVVAVAGRSTLTAAELAAAELAAAGIAAVYPLSDLEPDLERCRAEAGPLLRRAGQMIARDRLAEAVIRG
jgi:glycerate kinase